ncbi:MAG: CvpA family protein [Desulfosalsimonadaceae bacterium]
MAIVALFGYCLLVGVFRGFIKEAASIIGLVGGLYAGYAGYSILMPFFSGFIDTPEYQAIASFVLVFTGVFLLANVLGHLLRLLVKVALLGAVDRFFGALLGSVKAVVVVSLAFVLLMTFLPSGGKRVLSESRLAPAVNSVSSTLVRIMPEEKRRQFLYGLKELEKKWS